MRIIVILLVILLSCNSRQNHSDIVVVDTNEGKSDPTTFMLSQFVDSIRYIALSIPDSIYASSSFKIQPTKDYLVALDRNTNKVMLFSNEGKFMRDISSSETKDIIDFYADEQDKVIYLLDSKRKKVSVVDFTNHTKYFFPTEGYPQKLSLYQSSIIFFHGNEGKGSPDHPNIYLTNKKGEMLKRKVFAKDYDQVGYASYTVYNYKDTFVVWDQTSDIAYSVLPDLTLIPRFQIFDDSMMPKPLFFSKEREQHYKDYFVVDAVMEFNDYIFVDGLNKRWHNAVLHNKSNHKNSNLVYDYDVLDHGFTNDINGGPPFWLYKQISDKVLYCSSSFQKFNKLYNNARTKNLTISDSSAFFKLEKFINSVTDSTATILQIAYFK